SQTRVHLFDLASEVPRTRRDPDAWITLTGITRHNLDHLDVRIPVGALTSVTGVSGSGKSSLISQALVELVSARMGREEDATEEIDDDVLEPTGGELGELDGIDRLVVVDQKPIGRTPRSNLATYTGLFDNVRKLFAATKLAKARKYDAGRFSFNVAKGRCERCEGEGFVFVEMLFLPSVYAPCPVCHGARYNEKTLEVTYRDKSIADVLGLTVDAAFEFFSEEPAIHRSLDTVRQVGLGYLRLGQPATELSGGEAQRIKLATELQRSSRGKTLYVLDEPTTGLHPSDVSRLLAQLDALVTAGNTVVCVEHEMKVVAASDWVIDLGPGAGDKGGHIVAEGPPAHVAAAKQSKTASFLRAHLDR
ncbi:MAG TPA: excinuclease ABC subunit UvrA, partial [Kofleriaceae bacterium]